MANTCLGCRSAAVRLLVDLGPQPPSNRFESAGKPDTSRHPLTLGQCPSCGLLQLTNPMPPQMVKARVDWLAYNEPEGHLDDVVSRLAARLELTRDARIVGLTYKDDTTLRRFNDLGFSNTYRYDRRADLGIDDPCAGLESIQAALYPATTRRLLARHGAADLLLARHVLEHAHAPMSFLAQLRLLVKPEGHILFEVPDAAKFVETCDYAFLWEEHITYFARSTMAALMAHARLPVVEWMIHRYPLEDSLIAFTRNAVGQANSANSAPAAILAAGETFARNYPGIRSRLQSRLAALRREGKRIAVYGAGHLAARFVNLYELRDTIEFVIDDHPAKQGLLMPGSRLPICGSAALADIHLCLSALSPESERNVAAKHSWYFDRGGLFMSIFAGGPNSIYSEPVQ